MNCPACHRRGTELDSTGVGGSLFACETPDCVVQTFDVEGAQTVHAPETVPPSDGGVSAWTGRSGRAR
jgi:hypothetical protein